MEEERRKVYVEVDVTHKTDGTGLRYTVMICGTETFLFDEENGKWFVEGKKRAVL